MRSGLVILGVAAACGLAGVFHAAEAEDMIVVEQDYSIVGMDKGGVQAKDVRQKIYITRDWVCIDEGKDPAKPVPAESILLDLKGRQIINLNHESKVKVTETFEARRKRIENRVKTAEEDLRDQPAGPQRAKLEKLYSALLDSNRRFALAEDAGLSKNISGADCRPVKVIDRNDPKYAPFDAQLHPAFELPYDNTEVLFLLQLMGKGLADFLKLHKDQFKYVPMELHMELAIGGHLDTKVVSVQRVAKDKLAPDARGTLGSPFQVPASYREYVKKTAPVKKDPKEENPD